MKRFINLGNQITCIDGDHHFAWYNTVVDHFEEHSSEQQWETWADFKRDYQGDDLPRYRGLFPAKWPKIEGGRDD